MRGRTIAIAAAIGAATYYGAWRGLVFIGFSPLWALLIVIAVVVIMAGATLLVFQNAGEDPNATPRP